MDGRSLSTRPKADRRSTMTDVAKRAQVSVSTVSHVLNGTASISPAASQKVMDAVKELHYLPNALARGLRQSQTMVVGLIVPDIRNEFYSGCASGVLQAADRDNYTVLLCDCCYDLGREERSVRALIERRVDGLIFFGGAGDEKLICDAGQAGIPVVLGDRSMDGFSSVEFTNIKTMRRLTRQLYDLGKRRFCFVSEPVEMLNLRERYEGYLLGLGDCGIPPSHHVELIDRRMQHKKVDTAREVLLEYLDGVSGPVPEVFLTSCDLIAMGVMSALYSKGLRVPEDIGVVGFDDIMLAAYANPPLTTVRQDMQYMGQRAFSVLLDMLRDADQVPIHLMLDSQVVLRGSI